MNIKMKKQLSLVEIIIIKICKYCKNCEFCFKFQACFNYDFFVLSLLNNFFIYSDVSFNKIIKKFKHGFISR